MRLVLSRASLPEDLDQLVPLAYRSFNGDPMLPVFFGPEDPANHARLKKEWIKGTKEVTDFWLKIVDEDAEEVEVEPIDVGEDGGEETNGTPGKRKEQKIVGACDWRIYPTHVPAKDDEEEKPLEEEYCHLPTHQQRLDSKRIITEYMAGRKQETAEAHVFCYMLFVEPEYQGMGVGTMFMQWGNDIADTMMLPCWLESSAKGLKLYQKMGYKEFSRKPWETESFEKCTCIRMRRPEKVVRMEGREMQKVA